MWLLSVYGWLSVKRSIWTERGGGGGGGGGEESMSEPDMRRRGGVGGGGGERTRTGAFNVVWPLAWGAEREERLKGREVLKVLVIY